MRVIAGSARRLPLKTIEGLDTRPTTDRIKETLFNILQADVPGASVLDLFSGSGAIGIEALSRGAAECVFVEKSKEACNCIRENLAFTKLAGNQATVMEMDCISAVSRMSYTKKKFDLVFMDPPYHDGLERPVLETIRRTGLVDENTLFIIEAEIHTDFEYLDEIGYELVREKNYKTNKHVFCRRKGENE